MTDTLTEDERKRAVDTLSGLLDAGVQWRALALRLLSLCEAMKGPDDWKALVRGGRGVAEKLDKDTQSPEEAL